ncbi:Putative uncharacterized protein ART2 [Eumeta japonica]|uniref:Uncharacterized protein n=1 Tax=Eumeta variegata TaxID=151549 RepID=A0A4C1ZKW6_EUMVA|nr:Putative uncharacterized protein ART2 [Eumeta japonica]
MIGRADIEESKSDVAMGARPPQTSYPCVPMRTEHLDQASFCPSAPREVSVLAELALGHLRYSLAGVPPQSNSPPGSVFGSNHAKRDEAFGYLKRVIVTPAVYPCFDEFLHVDIPSTGQKSHCVNTREGHRNAMFLLDSRILLVRASSELAVYGGRSRTPTRPFTLELDSPRPSEPILIPKLRIQFADFPYLHYSIDQRLFTSETCCGYGYEPARHYAYVPHLNFQGPYGGSGHRSIAMLFAFRTASPFYRIPRNSNAQIEKKTLPEPPDGVFRPVRFLLQKHIHKKDFSLSLGSTDSRATTVYAKPFSTSVLRGLTGVFATTTKICTDGGSRRAHAQTLLRSPPRSSYSLRLNGGHWPSTARAGNADTNLHGHRPDVLNVQPLLGNCERLLGALTLRSVHPAAPVLLTKIGPLGTVIESRASIFKQAGVLTHLEFEKS